METKNIYLILALIFFVAFVWASFPDKPPHPANLSDYEIKGYSEGRNGMGWSCQEPNDLGIFKCWISPPRRDAAGVLTIGFSNITYEAICFQKGESCIVVEIWERSSW